MQKSDVLLELDTHAQSSELIPIWKTMNPSANKYRIDEMNFIH